MREYAMYAASVHQSARGTSLIRRFYENWKARRKIRELEQYDDFMLRDFGINRGDLRWAEKLPLQVDPFYVLHNQVRIEPDNHV